MHAAPSSPSSKRILAAPKPPFFDNQPHHPPETHSDVRRGHRKKKRAKMASLFGFWVVLLQRAGLLALPPSQAVQCALWCCSSQCQLPFASSCPGARPSTPVITGAQVPPGVRALSGVGRPCYTTQCPLLYVVSWDFRRRAGEPTGRPSSW
jgi:hypothetical protein